MEKIFGIRSTCITCQTVAIMMIHKFIAGGGDKDARDFQDMQRERKLREGKKDENSTLKGIGSFEKHTRVYTAIHT